MSLHSQINWSTWVPTEEATILFVIQDGKILLIHKKRGLGAGLINGPGGRIEQGETPEQCALRETKEELGIEVRDPRFAGELYFDMTDGYKLRGTVYTATRFTGVPTETDEATPEWFPLDGIPFERMWSDDRLWFPYMLAGKQFVGRFIFDGMTMLWHEVVETEFLATT